MRKGEGVKLVSIMLKRRERGQTKKGEGSPSQLKLTQSTCIESDKKNIPELFDPRNTA